MLSIVSLTSWLSRLGCIVLGSFYPAYASYRAVLSRDPDEHKQWLAFWVLAAGLSLAELFGDACISWLPLYHEAKLAGLAWLTLHRGATLVYDSLVHKCVRARARGGSWLPSAERMVRRAKLFFLPRRRPPQVSRARRARD